MKSYRDLEIYQISLKLFYKTHKLSLELPQYELYELGSQVRRSANSINSNIIEGYGRRRYKADFIKFLTNAYASNLETMAHVEKIKHIHKDHRKELNALYKQYDNLGAKIYKFIKYVEHNWKT